MAAVDRLLTLSNVLVPPGTMVSFAGKSIPTGWLLCNGANVSRTTYSKLFAAIGATWGAGDGSTTFTLPSCEGRFLEGTADASKVGTYLEAGLPNITGKINTGDRGSHMGGSGATLPTSSTANFTRTSSDSGAHNEWDFSATRVSSIYGAATTVQPPAAYVLIIIKT